VNLRFLSAVTYDASKSSSLQTKGGDFPPYGGKSEEYESLDLGEITANREW
jgi:hypothetical protein